MSQPRINKDPSDIADYGFDYATDFLGARTIASSEWIVPAGLTEESSAVQDGVATIRLSGGTAGRRYTVTNRITLANGEQFDHSMQIFVTQL